MSIKEIVKWYLKNNRFDGLCGDYCGCGFDDFMPCGDPHPDACKPAFKWKIGELKKLLPRDEAVEIDGDDDDDIYWPYDLQQMAVKALKPGAR